MTTHDLIRVSAAGGENGTIRSDNDLLLKLAYEVPARLGSHDGRTASEQLFAAGYATCFSAVITQVAHAQAVSVCGSGIEVTAYVDVNLDGQDSSRFPVMLEVKISGLDQAAANAVVAAAHKVCPYSNAIKGNIDVWFLVTIG